jgi:dUTPase
MLANSVGVFDLDYQGELLVCLTRHNLVRQTSSKIDNMIFNSSTAEKTMDKLFANGPVKAVQAVFLPAPYMGDFNVVKVEDYVEDATERGSGGFGSTDNLINFEI